MNDRTQDTDQPQTAQTQQPAQPSIRGEVSDVRDDQTAEGFLPADRMNDLRGKWSDVQASFVDDPRSAVQQAHQLVSQVTTELTETFTRERSALESQWSGGGQADTEALRVALQRYRSFFNRLLGTAPMDPDAAD